ncbi:MAG TPA: hypothetical protein PLL78_06930 [Fimbriimonadaceae bacterium]|nr:hypothetical protein [Fimbriimonadaceae bacterium]HRJ96404.1 hypothetical protein [Fimbriimonadaceae bacterium]
MLKFFWLAPLAALPLTGPPEMAGYEVTARAGLDAHTSLGHFDVNSIVLDIRATGEVRGEATFAADGHSHRNYPDVVVMVPRVGSVEVVGTTAQIEGDGTFQGNPVKVLIRVTDGGPRGVGDQLHIQCMDSRGRIVFHAHGPTISGDIAIRKVL